MKHLNSMISGPQTVSRPTFIYKFLGEREIFLYCPPLPRGKADSYVFLLPSFFMESKFSLFLHVTVEVAPGSYHFVSPT